MANKTIFWYNYKRFVDEGTIKPLSPKTFVVSGLITVCGLVLSLIIYCLAFPDSLIGENIPIKLFLCTLLYMLGTLAMIGGVYFGISLVVTRFIPTKSNILVLRCFMYVVQIVLFLLVFIGGFENYFSVYGISYYSDDIKAIKSDFVMMVNSAKDMFSDTETLKGVRFDTMPYSYFRNQGRNAVYIDAIDDNDCYTKLMVSPDDKSKIDFSAYYDVTYYPNTMTISSLTTVGEYDAAEEARKKEQNEITDLLNDLLDMDIEITLEVNEEGTIFIKRPQISYYDGVEGVIPLDMRIYLLVKKNGIFYDYWDFSSKTWLNDLTFLDPFHKSGDYEMTLVYGYDEKTGEYTPVSNTILYTIDNSGIPNTDYVSISLDGTSSKISSNE